MSSPDTAPEPDESEGIFWENASEEEFWRAVQGGPQVIFPAAGTSSPSSSPTEELRADFVGKVLRHHKWVSSATLSISGAKIHGALDLTSMSLPILILQNCQFDTLKLDNSQVPAVRLNKCRGRKISAEETVVNKDFSLRDLEGLAEKRYAPLQVSLVNARIGGSLDCAGLTLGSANPDAPAPRTMASRALDCYRLKVGEYVSLLGVRVQGEINFVGAEIGNRFTCSGRLSNPCCSALTCDGMVVRGSMYIGDRHNRLTPASKAPDNIEGGVRLVGAHVEGEVNLTAVEISNKGDIALDAEHLQVGSDLYLDKGFAARGLVRLVGAEVGRQVNCTDGKFHNGSKFAINADGLAARDIYLNSGDGRDGSEPGFIAEGGIRLVGARASRQLLCSGAKITSGDEYPPGTALYADHIEARDIYLDSGFQASGKIQLADAHIGNRVSCTEGKFEAGPASHAMCADGTTATGLLFDRGFKATGEVSLVSVTAADQLNCTGGEFCNPQGYALRADRSSCGNLYLNRDPDKGYFVAEGAVSFWGATLGSVDCHGGRFHAGRVRPMPARVEGYGSYALDLADTTVRGDVFGEHAKLEGGLSLANAHILGNVDFIGADIIPTDDGRRKTVLNGQGLTVDGALNWRLSQTPRGKVDVSHAKVGRLSDDLGSWPKPRRGRRVKRAPSDLNLNGFQYRGLDGRAASVRERLSWLASAAPFSRQPYEELTRAYREAGDERYAREVIIREQREGRRQEKRPVWSRLWSVFLDVTVGYGYKIHRLLIGLVIWAAFGFALFHWAEHHGIMEAVGWHPPATCDSPKTPNPGFPPCTITSESCTRYYPCFWPGIYATQLLLPVINFRQLEYWLPDMTQRWGPWFLVYTWVTIILGYLAVTALAGGLGRVWRTSRDG